MFTVWHLTPKQSLGMDTYVEIKPNLTENTLCILPAGHFQLKYFHAHNVWLKAFSFMNPASCCRWHPWSILWPAEAVWVRRLPSREQLPVSGRLCGQGEAVAGNHLSSARLQNQVPWEFLSVEGKPRVCFNQQNIWILWWVWVTVNDKHVVSSVRKTLVLTRTHNGFTCFQREVCSSVNTL